MRKTSSLQGSRGGMKLKCRATSWDDLPCELEESILCHLSLAELAAVSSTRKTFLAAFRKNLADQQKALCDLALERFGREQTKAFADLLRGCFADNAGDQDLRGKFAPLNVRWCNHTLPMLSTTLNPIKGNIMDAVFVVVNVPRHKRWVRQSGRIRRQIWLSVAYLDLGQRELGWLIMLQALLSEGVFSSLPDGVTVCIRTLRPPQPRTLAWMKAHAAPLMPLLAQCSFESGGQKIFAKQRMRVGQAGADGNKGISLVLR